MLQRMQLPRLRRVRVQRDDKGSSHARMGGLP
jgi:hypothetical protein